MFHPEKMNNDDDNQMGAHGRKNGERNEKSSNE
jgi:hypothetical protein